MGIAGLGVYGTEVLHRKTTSNNYVSRRFRQTIVFLSIENSTCKKHSFRCRI